VILLIPEPPEILPITFGKETMDEGEFAQVVCIVSKGDEPLHLSWLRCYKTFYYVLTK
jgi:hypothetical protein